MKKFKKIPIINVKAILTIISAGILCVSLAFSVCFILSTNFSHKFVDFMVNMGTKTPPEKPQVDFTQTILSLSFPGISFKEKATPVMLSTPSPITTELPTEIPTEIPINTAQSITYESAEEIGYTSIDGIYINNQTSKSVNIDNLLNKTLDLSLSDEPSVLIIHTHTTESYTPSSQYNYTPTETDRTTDPKFNMVSVGEVIYEHLTANGINAIHDTSVNDYPSYSTSYSKSLKLVESYKEKYPSIKIVIDVHRDAIISKDGTKLRPVTSFEPEAAQVMMVVGTNDSGLNHPNWQENLSFALQLQHKMNSLFPSLARPINLRRERFNQHLAPYAFILEVGTNGNTLEEAKEGARLFSETLVALLKN